VTQQVVSVVCSDGLRPDSLLTSVVLLSVWHYEPLLPDTFLGEVVLLVDNFRNFHQLNNRRYQSRAEWLPLRRPTEPVDGPFAVCFTYLLCDCSYHIAYPAISCPAILIVRLFHVRYFSAPLVI